MYRHVYVRVYVNIRVSNGNVKQIVINLST